MNKVKASLQKLIGRIDKVKLIRDLLFMGFAAFLVFLSPTISELLTVNNWSELNELFQANQLLPWLVMLPFIVLGIMLCFARKIDAWESRETDKKADKRHQELLSAIRDNPFNNSVQELINEIRQDRNERNNRDSK